MRTLYSIKDYLIKPIVSKIDDEENRLRYEVMDYIIREHKPYDIKGSHNYDKFIDLEKRNILSINDNDEITAIYPVSAVKTNKKIIFEDGSYAYAMCAIDAIGFHYTFEKNIIIESECELCKEKITISLRDGKINIIHGGDQLFILHADLKNNSNWSCSCCNIMHFFNCRNNLIEWKKDRCINNKVFEVGLETANKIAWLLFSK